MGDVRRLIVFDLDGTLIDSRRDLVDSANQLIVELGGRPLLEERIAPMIGEGARVLVQRALAAAGLSDRPGVLSRFLQIYDSRLLDHTRMYDGIADVLRDARERASLAVLTNKPAGLSERILTGLGIRDAFADIIGGDGPYPRKPDPSGLLALMQRAGASAQRTLLVGDSVIDQDTARRASVGCCLATYGFGFESFPRNRLTGEEFVAADPMQLGRILVRFLAEERVR